MFFGQFAEKATIQVKSTVASFWATVGKIVAIFLSNIWSHWSAPAFAFYVALHIIVLCKKELFYF